MTKAEIIKTFLAFFFMSVAASAATVTGKWKGNLLVPTVWHGDAQRLAHHSRDG